MENYTTPVLPACLLTKDQAMGVAAADSTALVAAGWLVHSVWTPLFPQLSYHTVLLLTPVLCHMRGLQITCCSVPQSPLHTNSGTPCLSLWGPSDTHRCPLPQGTGAVDMSCRMKGRDDLSVFHCSVSTYVATCIALYSPHPLPPLPESDSSDSTLLI